MAKTFEEWRSVAEDRAIKEEACSPTSQNSCAKLLPGNVADVTPKLEGETANPYDVASKATTRLDSDKLQFECTQCGKRFAKKWQLVSHNGFHANKKPCPSTESDVMLFPGASSANQRRIHSSITAETHNGKSCNDCSVCGLSFTRSSTLTYHMRAHEEGRHHRGRRCRHCSREFSRARDLSRHACIHSRERPRPHRCDVCGDLFSLSDSLSAHRRPPMVPAGSSPTGVHQCRLIGQTFDLNSQRWFEFERKDVMSARFGSGNKVIRFTFVGLPLLLRLHQRDFNFSIGVYLVLVFAKKKDLFLVF